MKTIAIIGTNLENLICAHQILDNNRGAKVYLIDAKAEAGLDEEGPGLIEANTWPPLPRSWIGKLGSQEPTTESTAVRRSWFEKALATKLSERGGIFLMRTTISEETVEGNTIKIKLGGAGPLTDKQLILDHLIKFEEADKHPIWSGGVYSMTSSEEEIQGIRPDRLVEMWWKGENTHRKNPLEVMKWKGENPTTSIVDTIRVGIKMGNNL
tara:strand:+ start:1030 stop:1662 length:633 start_codon:yes stop_codon:yes gene_type:complete